MEISRKDNKENMHNQNNNNENGEIDTTGEEQELQRNYASQECFCHSAK